MPGRVATEWESPVSHNRMSINYAWGWALEGLRKGHSQPFEGEAVIRGSGQAEQPHTASSDPETVEPRLVALC